MTNVSLISSDGGSTRFDELTKTETDDTAKDEDENGCRDGTD